MGNMNFLEYCWLLFLFASFTAKSTGSRESDVCENMTKLQEEKCCSHQVNFARERIFSDATLPTNISTPILKRITIWIMVPFTDPHFMFSKNHVEPAVNRALMDANVSLCSNRVEDDGICYEIFVNDSQCNSDHAVTEAVSIHESNLLRECSSSDAADLSEMNVFLGLSCDITASRVGAFATSWSWPAIIPGPRSTVFDDKSSSCCETMTRPGHSATDLGKFVYQLYNRYDRWNNSYLIYVETSNHGAPISVGYWSDCSTFASGINSVFSKKGWSYPPSHIKNVPSDNIFLDDSEVSSILNDIKANSRVSLWCIGKKAMRLVMNQAHAMGMTSGNVNERFAFFYIDLYNTNKTYQWTDEDDQPCEDILPTGYCNSTIGDSSGLEALQVITLYQSNTEEFKDFSEDMKNKIGPEIAGPGQFVNPFVTEYYDATMLLIQGVERYKQNDLSNGSVFTTTTLWNTSFQSVDGLVSIAETGDRMMNYAINDLNMSTGLFEEVEVYFGANSTWVNYTQIDWPGQIAPKNIPECGEYVCPEEPESKFKVGVLAGCIALAFIIALIFLIYAYRRKLHHERKLQSMLWKAKHEDIIFETTLRRRDSSVSSSSGSIISTAGNRQKFSKTARWKGLEVAVKDISYVTKVVVNRNLQLEMEVMLSLAHENICKFFGATVESPIMILTEYCSRGSLEDFLESSVVEKLDDDFRISLMSDIAHGMRYLHDSRIHSHGNLKSSNCLLDGRLVVKITDFGLVQYRLKQRRDSVIGYNHHKDMLWTAPELLRRDDHVAKGTQKGDVYSFAIIMQEILYKKGAFYLGDSEDSQEMTPTEIHDLVIEIPTPLTEPFRPTLEDSDDIALPEKIRALVERCWEENPEERPGFPEILIEMKRHTKKQNLLERMLNRLDQYSSNLEEKVEERTRQYKAEKERADNLLHQMLPKAVADRLKRMEEVPPVTFDCVTIYFSDIVGFTDISHRSTAMEVVGMLNSLYTVFDRQTDNFDVYKVETIGDAYMVVSGLPEKNEDRHATEICQMALNLLDEVRIFKIPHMPERRLALRIGIHSGSVVTGVVGKSMPRYCLFGDTVNTAARMEQSGKELKIHISPATKLLLDKFDRFVVKQREDEVFLKGLGTWKTWWLEGDKKELDNKHLGTKISETSDYGSIASGDIAPPRPRKSVTGVEDGEYLALRKEQKYITANVREKPGKATQFLDEERGKMTGGKGNARQRRVGLQFEKLPDEVHSDELGLISSKSKLKKATSPKTKRVVKFDDVTVSINDTSSGHVNVAFGGSTDDVSNNDHSRV